LPGKSRHRKLEFHIDGNHVNQALGLTKREGFVNKTDDYADDSPLDEV